MSGDVYYTTISINSRFRYTIDQIKETETETKTWERIYALGDKALSDVKMLIQTTDQAHHLIKQSSI